MEFFVVLHSCCSRACSATCAADTGDPSDNGGTYCVEVSDGSMEVIEGGKESPTFTLKMDGDEYIKMAHGKLNGAMAFMTGKMKISGDRGLAQTMKKIFPLIK